MGKMGCCKLKDGMFELFVQSEAEQEDNLSKDFKNRRDWSVVSSNTKKGGLVRSSSGVWSSQDSPFRHSDGSATTLVHTGDPFSFWDMM